MESVPAMEPHPFEIGTSPSARSYGQLGAQTSPPARYRLVRRAPAAMSSSAWTTSAMVAAVTIS
jgi:hypothetical protein